MIIERLFQILRPGREAQIGNTIYRGFYATGDDLLTWYESMRTWFFDDRRVVYIKGQMLDKQARNNSYMFGGGYKFIGGGTLTYVGHVKQRWGIPWNQFHSFTRNCQDKAKIVYT